MTNLRAASSSLGVRRDDPRAIVKSILKRFQSKCSRTTGKNKHLEVYELLKAEKYMVQNGEKILGEVPGVQLGDGCQYRAELSLIGLHRPLEAGVDSLTLPNGFRIASSIVVSGSCKDQMQDGVLRYTGSGGVPTRIKKGRRVQVKDQVLKGGNGALANSIVQQNPVRVIYGTKERDRVGRKVMRYTYDGLYRVENYETVKEEFILEGGQKRQVNVFNFTLKRIERTGAVPRYP